MGRFEYRGLKKLAIGLGFLLLSVTPSAPLVLCSLPFTLTNGTTADATQVMANYNSIITCLTNAAAQGVNVDITALNGLTTPLPPSEGGTPVYTASVASTGAANAQVVATPSPTGFTLSTGKKIVFVAGFSNTTAMTLQVGGTVATNFFRMTPSGPVAMVGGEIVVGQLVEAVFDGTQYEMTSTPALNYAPGTVFDYAGASGCPVGSAATNGQNLATASFPTLSAVLGLSWGNPGGGNFTLPDLRGRTTFGLDNGQGRITVAGGNFDGTIFANTGGQQNQTLTQAQLPNIVPTFSGTSANVTFPANTDLVNTGAGGNPASGSGLSLQGASATVVATGTISSINGNVTEQSHPVLSNGAIVLKCVKE